MKEITFSTKQFISSIRILIPVIGILLLSNNVLQAQSCIQYAVSIGDKQGNITNQDSSLNAPDGKGALFTGNEVYTRLVWNMGTVLPAGTQVCFKVKKTGSGGASFKTWYGLDGIDPHTGAYTEIPSSFTNVTNTVYQDLCVTIPVGCRYVKISQENTTDFKVDAVQATYTCCTGKITSLYFNKIDGGTDLSISAGQNFNVNTLGSMYNLEAGVTGTIGSVKFTITGTSPGTNTENTAPYNYPGTGSALTAAKGTYTVNIKVYSETSAGGNICHDTTITFNVIDPACNINAGADKTVSCVTTFPGGSTTMSATAISGGAWTPVASGNPGTATITTASSASTTIKNFTTTGIYKFVWSISGCSDTASVTVTGKPNAGTDKTASCVPTFPGGSATMSATAISGGAWSAVATGNPGTATITTASNASTTIINFTTAGTYKFVWSVAGCSDTASILVTGKPNAGVDKSPSCVATFPGGSATMAATAVSGGVWSPAASGNPGTATITTPGSATTTITNYSAAGTYNFIWTAGGCSDTAKVTVTGCCNGRITSVYFKKVTGDNSTLAITNSGNYNINTIANVYNIEAATSGTIGSVIFNISGPTASSNTENTTPYNAPGGDTPWNPALGSYSINIKIYSEAGGAGSICHDTTITLNIINPDCGCEGNLVLNPSFETYNVVNSENIPTNWTATQPYNTFRSHEYAAQCGTYAGQQDGTSNTNLATFYQDISLSAGSQVLLKFKAGTHVASDVAKFGLIFFNGNTRLDSSLVEVDHVLEPGPTMQDYSISATAPAGTTKIRIIGKTGADWLKVDLICLTVTSTPVNLGDRVWYDQNNNGIQDAGEPGLAGAVVKLYDATGTTQIGTSQTTTATGLYNFINLTPGTYVVGVTPPAGYKSSSVDGGDPDTNPANNDDNGVGTGTGETKSLAVDLTNGGEPTTDGDGANGNLTVDFGFAGTGSIGDFVWNDNNGNGIQNGGTETGVAGVIVTLTYTINGTAFTVKDTTDAAGLYLFPNLPPATYTVSFATPSGRSATTSNAGGNTSNNSGTDTNDSDPINGVVSGIILSANENNLGIDAGFFTLAALGNFVWNDLNADGIQDAGEPGIPNVPVTLTNVTTSATTPTTTNSSGKYLFSNLAPGTYKVTFGTPSGYLPTTANFGADDKDSDAGAGGVTGNYTLVGGQVDSTVDAGFYQTASIGDYVWLDANADGRQNTTEAGVANVMAKLTNVNTNEMFTTTTNSSGKYLFTNLLPGTYKVQFTPPAGPNGNSYGFTRSNFGTDDLDSDIGATFETGNYTLVAGQVDTSVDAGLTLPDLQPTLTFSPTSFVVYASNNYTLPISVVCRISEVNRAATNGTDIVVKIPRTIFINFTYQPTLTSINGQPLNNNQWAFSQNSTYWIFTYSGTLAAYDDTYFGFNGTFNTYTASGVYFMVAEIVAVSGGEMNYNNNMDSERADYFSN